VLSLSHEQALPKRTAVFLKFLIDLQLPSNLKPGQLVCVADQLLISVANATQSPQTGAGLFE
jgi:hypothetical protein